MSDKKIRKQVEQFKRGRKSVDPSRADKALKAAAAAQKKAGSALLKGVMKSKAKLKAAAKSPAAFRKALDAEFRRIAKLTEQATRKAALDVAVIADTNARAQAI
ncbi:hypothetical protein LCGC14_2461960, partial [marine sediment metagenome]